MSSPANIPPTNTGAQVPFPSLLERLEAYSQQPDFQYQRELALSRFLQPYLSKGQGFTLNPLPAEVELAKLYLYSDYYPNDGHLTLVEQARDEILKHLTDEERIWLDPLRHSFMDLLEIVALGRPGSPNEVRLKSLGDSIEYGITSEDLVQDYQPGQMLLTRLIRRPEYTYFPGIAVGLSHKRGQQVYDYVRELQQEMEAEAGAFELGEWQEFTKRFGHVLIWALGQLRLQWLLEVEEQVHFLTSDHTPYLFCIGIYEHHEAKFFNEMLQDAKEWKPEALEQSIPKSVCGQLAEPSALKVWVHESDTASQEQHTLLSRLTITPTQIFAESDSLDHFNDVKHFLASTFGFSLHFKGELTEPPLHTIPEMDLLTDDAPPLTPFVSKEEEHDRLVQLLELVYLGWAEHPCPALNKCTPRQVAHDADAKSTVAQLINQLEHHDLAFLRTGKHGYDYQALRAHVGLDAK
ncbi:hypothetical protein [Candidatus Nitronereus thalassa]|uniref:Uncharacterized protein n=1 Tax=Candidatus Nitronereus thalassa TaxID=3020898 RepID=A0ABU3K8V6_9BACT|nr:hypothetical protein [Candidatus Nitronereus thalassa]MDT7042830.1 hypothetical protein [Candidatus Nitronereus thalassa]